MLVLPVTVTATDYFIDNTNPGASNNNPGTNPALPWMTMRRAGEQAPLQPGDTVTVLAGAYNERVFIQSSGASNNPITFRAVQGPNRARIRAFTLTNRSHIVLDGFEITDAGMTPDSTANILATGSTGVRIINNYIHDTMSFGIRCNPNAGGAKCNGLIVRNNVMSFIGPAWNGANTGRLPLIELWGDNSLIEENDLSRGEDFFRVYGNRNVFRNNVLHDSREAETLNGASHIDGFQSYCTGSNPAPQAANFLLVEGNIHRDNPDLNSHFGLINDTQSCGGSRSIIVRYNSISNVGSGSYYSDRIRNIASHHKYYNNTTVVGGIGVTPKNTHYAVILDATTFGSVINNIFVDAIAPTPPASVYLLDNSATSNARNNFAYLSSGLVNFQPPISLEPTALALLNRAPQFVSATDFNLRPGSPARRAGSHLTNVSANDSGNGFTLIVNDAHFFQDGWAGVTPDTIAVGSDTNVAQISSINYNTNTITLVAPISRSAGQPVWLFRNSTGGKVMYSTAPDLGAFPFQDVGISVETKGDGSGTVIPDQTVSSSGSFTAFAIERDDAGNFMANVAATWSLTNIVGGVVAGDLVPAADGRSAVFTGNAVGSAQISAVSSGSAGLSGVITVVPAGSVITVETRADGGGVVLPAQDVAAGFAVTGFAIQRDLLGNFISNVSATWSLMSVTGGVVGADLGAAADGKSAVFTGRVIGTARVRAIAGGLSGDSGVLTVVPGLPGAVTVETAATGNGGVLAAQHVPSGASVSAFAIQRDAFGNFLSNTAAAWSLTSVTGGIVDADLVPAGDNRSAVFTGHQGGTARITAQFGNFAGNSGILTVVAGGAVSLSIETAPNGGGNVLPAQSVVSGSTVIAFAIQRDVQGNFVSNAAATWSLTGITGGVVNADLVPAADGKSAVFTGRVVGTARMTAVSGQLIANSSTLSVLAAAPSTISIETSADGGGGVVPSQNVTAGGAVTAFAIVRDNSGNFIANVAAAWSLSSATGNIANADLVPAADSRSAIFTGNLVGSARLSASAGGLTGNSGTLTVVAGAAVSLSIETAANGSGEIINTRTVPLSSSLTVFAILRDARGNFAANVSAAWSLIDITGAILATDLAAASDNRSATLNGRANGTARIRAVAAFTGTTGVMTVAPDNIPPTVSVTAPLNGALVSGNIPLSATATDDIAIAGVQFRVDGANVGAEDTTAPYSILWNASQASLGNHLLTAVARDAGGNLTISASVTVTVTTGDPIAPTVLITKPTTASNVSGNIVITTTVTDNIGVVGVQFKVDGVNLGAEIQVEPFETAWDTTQVSNGLHVLTAVARDAANNSTTSLPVTVIVGDSAAPIVFVTSPANGANVSGAVTITVAASDNIGVAGVLFKVDGIDIGAEVTSVPYSVLWNTLVENNGGHNLTAVARDDNGNTTTSAIVTVQVNNVEATVNYTIPSNGGVALITTGNNANEITIAHARLQQNFGAPPELITPETDDGLPPAAPNGSMMGVAMIGLRKDGVLVTETGVPGTPAIPSGRIYAEVRGVVNTGIALSNPNFQDAVITFNITDSSGTDLPSSSITLKGNSQMAAFLNQPPFNSPPDLLGTFTFRSSIPIGAIALRGVTNERGEFLLTTLPVPPLGSQPQADLPHFADGGGWTTQVILTNTSDSMETGTIQFFGQGDGNQPAEPLNMTVNGLTASMFNYSIPGHSMARLVTSGIAAAVQAGSVRITPSGNNIQNLSPNSNVPGVVAILSYRNPAGVLVSEASIAGTPSGTAFGIYVESSGVTGEPGSIQSGLAIANPSATAVTITIQMTRLDGSPSGLAPRTLTVPAGGQATRLINEIFPTLPSGFKGIARLTAPSSLSVAALRTRYNERQDFLITTTPPLNESLPALPELIFPHVVSGQGYSTNIVVFGQPGSGKLFLLSQDGKPKPSSSLSPLIN